MPWATGQLVQHDEIPFQDVADFGGRLSDSARWQPLLPSSRATHVCVTASGSEDGSCSICLGSDLNGSRTTSLNATGW